jgi:hypothetical protein
VVQVLPAICDLPAAARDPSASYERKSRRLPSGRSIALSLTFTSAREILARRGTTLYENAIGSLW